MKKFLINILCCFIPFKKTRKSLRKKLNRDRLSELENEISVVKCQIDCLNIKDELNKFILPDCLNLALLDGLGDTFCVFSLLNYIKKYNNCDIRFFIAKSHESLCKMYGITNYIVADSLTNRVRSVLLGSYVNRSTYPKKGELFFCHPRFHKDTVDINNNLKEENFNFMSYWKYFLKVPLSEKVVPYSYVPPISEQLSAFLGLINFNKTVIISHEVSGDYSENTMWWNNLANVLLKKGYTVIANTVNPKHEIRNAKNINPNLSDLISLCLKSFVVISVRNGLCDVLHDKGKYLFVFDSYFGVGIKVNSLSKKYFNLNYMYNRNDINEYPDFQSISIIQLVDKIQSLENRK